MTEIEENGDIDDLSEDIDELDDAVDELSGDIDSVDKKLWILICLWVLDKVIMALLIVSLGR